MPWSLMVAWYLCTTVGAGSARSNMVDALDVLNIHVLDQAKVRADLVRRDLFGAKSRSISLRKAGFLSSVKRLLVLSKMRF